MNEFVKRESSRQKFKRKNWQSKFAELTPAQRMLMVSAPSTPSEFEVQALIYNSLKILGWDIRGEVRSQCGLCVFDLVVFDASGSPLMIIEVKKGKASAGSKQSSRYAEFCIPVTLIRGLPDAERFIKKCTKDSLPPCTHQPSASLVGDVVELTRELIEAGRRPGGGFKKRQLQLIGVARPCPEDWIERSIGRRVHVAAYEQFLALKN